MLSLFLGQLGWKPVLITGFELEIHLGWSVNVWYSVNTMAGRQVII